jgi:hypothetical protein
MIHSQHGGAAMKPESLFSLSDHLERLAKGSTILDGELMQIGRIGTSR